MHLKATNTNWQKQNKQTKKRQLVVQGDYSSTAKCLIKICCDIWRDVWNFTRLFQKFYLLIYSAISRAEPLTMHCGTLVGKHWPRERMKKAKRNFGQDSRSKGWDFKLGPPEYGGVLPTQPQFPVTAPTITCFSSIKSCIRPCFCTLSLIYMKWWGYLHFSCLVTSVTGKTFDSITVYDLQCLATLLSWCTKFTFRNHDQKEEEEEEEDEEEEEEE